MSEFEKKELWKSVVKVVDRGFVSVNDDGAGGLEVILQELDAPHRKAVWMGWMHKDKSRGITIDTLCKLLECEPKDLKAAILDRLVGLTCVAQVSQDGRFERADLYALKAPDVPLFESKGHLTNEKWIAGGRVFEKMLDGLAGDSDIPF